MSDSGLSASSPLPASARSQPGVCHDKPLAITACGMVTSVGFDCASSSAAIRAGIDNFQETRMMDRGGEWILGAQVPLDGLYLGSTRLAKLLSMCLEECVLQAGMPLEEFPVLIALSEKDRPGRQDALGNRVFFETQDLLEVKFHPASQIIEHGRVAALVALQRAHSLIYEHKIPRVVLAGVDSLLTPAVMREFQKKERILTSRHSDGFIPGEGAAALVIEGADAHDNALLCWGVGFGSEPAPIDSGRPHKADGVTAALKSALLASSHGGLEDMDFRLVDVTGEQYWFKETTLAMSRLLRRQKNAFPIWHITDSVGEVGAATSVLSMAYLKTSFAKGFAPGSKAYYHTSNDDHRRAAAIFGYGKMT